MDRLLTQQLRIFYLKRRKKQNLYLYTQLSCSTKPNHFFILFISPFSLSFISKEIHHQRRFSLYFFFYYSFPKLNYRFRFAAGRASPSLIHFIFFFLHSVHQTINVCPDWCLFSSLAHASSSTFIYILQVDRKGADVDDIIFLLKTKSFALPFFFVVVDVRHRRNLRYAPQTSQRCSFLLIYVKWEQKKRDDEIKHCGHIGHHPTTMRNEPFRSGQKNREKTTKKASWDDDPVGLTTAMAPCFTNQWPRRRIRTKMETLSL